MLTINAISSKSIIFDTIWIYKCSTLVCTVLFLEMTWIKSKQNRSRKMQSRRKYVEPICT